MKLKFNTKVSGRCCKSSGGCFAGQPYLTPSYMIDRGSVISDGFTDEEDLPVGRMQLVPELNDFDLKTFRRYKS